MSGKAGENPYWKSDEDFEAWKASRKAWRAQMQPGEPPPIETKPDLKVSDVLLFLHEAIENGLHPHTPVFTIDRPGGILVNPASKIHIELDMDNKPYRLVIE